MATLRSLNYSRVLACCAVCIIVARSSTSSPPWTKSCKSTDTADDVLTGIDLSGKIIIYTGADGSMASESTLALARAKASLIFACRTLSKCDAARKKVLEKTGTTAFLEVEQLDLSSRSNIADFARRVTAKHPKIDVLINSAATYGTFMTHDKMVATMEINLLGPALLTDLLLPSLRGHGRVVNVAAAAYGSALAKNTTAADLSALCFAVDPTVNDYYQLSKFLMVHHALEVAKREPTVAAVALAPGVAIRLPSVPNWLKHWLVHFPYPKFLLKLLPEGFQHFIKACTTNEAGLQSCPETLAQGAGVIVAAAAWPDVESYSGIYLDFDTKRLPLDSPNVYGPWTQSDPTCVPRQPTPMDESLRSAWYDEMLRLMKMPGSLGDAHVIAIV
eukprot:TRINITY_DN23746_c0_g1_i1.p1 TRINITY_DN23746_c0_g1~~TRINITY_DN23746_c0_g1_i1.p1  ORF type:complete len:417 (-),score=56.47 TRINITY_DN23746_c0_g1_i1:81-1247(-)